MNLRRLSALLSHIPTPRVRRSAIGPCDTPSRASSATAAPPAEKGSVRQIANGELVRRITWPPPAAKKQQPAAVGGGGKTVKILIDDKLVLFDHVFLRDSCQCPLCVDPSTRQKLFQTSSIPQRIRPASSVQSENGHLTLTWTEDVPGYPEHHRTTLTADFLRTYSDSRLVLKSRWDDYHQVYWNKKILEDNMVVLDYNKYMQNEATLLSALKRLRKYGIIFIKGVPNSERAVEEIGTRIAPLKHTFYGTTWDVKSVPNAANIAYTDKKLPFHMDLLYLSSPPTFQLLHCLRNRAQGGSSVFADAFRAASYVRMTSPMLFQSLCNFPVPYHYKNDSQHYHFLHPTVVLSRGSQRPARHKGVKSLDAQIEAVNWSPPFQAPLEGLTERGNPTAELRSYFAAVKAFTDQLEIPSVQFEKRMEEGECIIFDNRRIVHARRAFDASSGERWLRGAYLDGDPFRSRLRVLAAKMDEMGLSTENVQDVGGDEHI